MDIQIKSFFVTFTSKCIQAADCTKMVDALQKARGMVNDQEESLDSFLKNFIVEWNVDLSGLTLITKPIKHELFYDREVDHHYDIKNRFPMNRRAYKYDVGGAIIFIPMSNLNPTLRFQNQDFVHGHITDGHINCWGKYGNIQNTVLHNGPLTALTAMYGFCKFSRYGSYLKSNLMEPTNAGK